MWNLLFEEVSTDPRWVEAMSAEITDQDANKTWTIVPLPRRKRPIGSKWFFKIKYQDSGEVDRFKARLVCKG